jgi:hypothetical protein
VVLPSCVRVLPERSQRDDECESGKRAKEAVSLDGLNASRRRNCFSPPHMYCDCTSSALPEQSQLNLRFR